MLAMPLTVAAAQHHEITRVTSPPRDSLSAMLTALSTTVSPALAGRARTELRLTQPMLALRGARAGGALQYSAMLNAERWTMPDGESVAGIWGEGFIDSRHPEEERLLDLVRTARPPNHLVIQGMTRWRIASAQLARDLQVVGGMHASLFTELARAQSRPPLRPVLLEPRDVIGANGAWHLTVGLRLGVGLMSTRAGRYGAAAGPA